MKCVFISLCFLVTAGTFLFNGATASDYRQLAKADLEEIRENLMEVRLALQKGDLIEALQHLNNADEDLLLVETGFSTPNSTKDLPSASNSYAQNNQGNEYDKRNKTVVERGNEPNSRTVTNNDSLPVGSSNTDDFIRRLNVTFNFVLINNDHDILFPAEWRLDGYVNDKRLQLSETEGLDRVESGQVIEFTDQTVAIDIPNNSSLRILTLGFEIDDKNAYLKDVIQSGLNASNSVMAGQLPDLSGILDINAPLQEYRERAEDAVQSLTTYDRNDAIGVIAREFDSRNNFGIGNHFDCSESSGEVGDLFDTVDTNCDYRLSYTIEEQ